MEAGRVHPPPGSSFLQVKTIKFTLLVVQLVLLVSLPLGVCADSEEAYLIGRDDVLDITVWQSPDLTKTLSVRSDGNIDYPLLGLLAASGSTPAKLAQIIRDKLAQGYVKDPQVSISVKEYNSKKILVFGEVAKPGLYKLKTPIPLLELLFMVGGVQQDAKRMTVIRVPKGSSDATPWALLPSSKEGDKSVESAKTLEVDLIALLSKGDLTQNVMIMPGDTLYVASGTGERYYVLGQVKKPGPYEWVQDITVLEAIKLADGCTERAAPHRIKVRKKKPNGTEEELKVNISDIMKGKKKDDVVVKPGDVIVVPESWI